MFDLVDKAAKPGDKFFLFGFIATDIVPEGEGALSLQLRHDLMLLVTPLLDLLQGHVREYRQVVQCKAAVFVRVQAEQGPYVTEIERVVLRESDTQYIAEH